MSEDAVRQAPMSVQDVSYRDFMMIPDERKTYLRTLKLT